MAKQWKMLPLAALVSCLLGRPALAAPETGVTVAAPWMRYLLPSLPAAGYMVLNNNGDTAAVITGASSPACGSLMLHQSTDSGGMAMMMDVQQVSVPAHGSVSFSSGGYHLMCMAPRMAVGGKVAVTLTFADGATLAALLPVYGAQGAP
jgi:copper(I)-binding protein